MSFPNTKLNFLYTTSLFLCLCANFSRAGNGFDVIALGVQGGIHDGNLSAFMISPHGDHRGVTCDAGTLINGIGVAVRQGSFDDISVPEGSSYTKEGHILRENIKGYLISHAHMDHIAGLVISSPADSDKSIYALAPVIQNIGKNYFNWHAWPNFAETGVKPRLGKYRYTTMLPDTPVVIKNTNMSVTAYQLSHNSGISTAFLIESGEDVLICFGDTGPDHIEKTDKMERVWSAVSEKVKTRILKGIIIESSYSNSRQDTLLYGHLTPKYIIEGLANLAGKMGNAKALSNMPIIINHIKYSLKKRDNMRQQISNELNENNILEVKFILPEQGERFHLK